MRSTLFTIIVMAAAATAAKSYDIIDTTSNDGLCKTCHAAMSAVNPALTNDTVTQVAELYFKLSGLSRPDLEAGSFLTAL